jgi:hypothetical protein
MILTEEETRLIIENMFPCSKQEQIKRGLALMASNSQAAKLHRSMKQALAQLDYLKQEDCPDELVDLTLARLKLAIAMKPLPQKNPPQ